MTLRRSLRFLLLVIAMMGLLHFLGLYFYLYYRLPNYDRFVHFLGGFWTASVALLTVRHQASTYRALRVMLIAIISALIIGFVWELFELSIGFTDMQDAAFWRDSVQDMIMDGIGGLCAGVHFIIKRKLSSHAG